MPTTDDLRRAGLTVINGQVVPTAHKKPIYENDLSNNPRMGAAFAQRSSALASESTQEVRSVGASQSRPRVTITMYRCGTPLDDDNEYIAPKALRDGLVTAGFIQGDSRAETDFIVQSVRVKTRKEIKTEIMIEEI